MCVTCCLEFKLFAEVFAQRGQLFTTLNLCFVASEVSHTLPCVSWLCVAVCGCAGEAMAGILIPVLLSWVLRNCSWDRCTFTYGSFTCKHSGALMGVVIACDVTFLSTGSSSLFLYFCCVKRDLFFLRILDLNGGSPPLTYKRFLHILSLLGDPEVPVRNLTAEDFQ